MLVHAMFGTRYVGNKNINLVLFPCRVTLAFACLIVRILQGQVAVPFILQLAVIVIYSADVSDIGWFFVYLRCVAISNS